MRAGLLYEFLEPERTLVSVTGPRDVSDEEWDGYLVLLAQLLRSLGSQLRLLAWRVGSRPTSGHIELLRNTIGSHTPRTAIVSSDSIMGFTTSVLKLRNRYVAMFAVADFETALTHLELGGRELETVKAAALRLAHDYHA